MRKLSIDELSRHRSLNQSTNQTGRFPLSVVLDNIRSLYNVGSIFRTSDAVNLQELILCGITGTPPRREIEKTALGAVESVPWRYEKSALHVLQTFRGQGIPVLALEQTEPSQPHWQGGFPSPCCLVLGNEVFGIQDELLPLIDRSIEIPMFGLKHSLNVSVAYGIAAYQMLGEYLHGSGSKAGKRGNGNSQAKTE